MVKSGQITIEEAIKQVMQEEAHLRATAVMDSTPSSSTPELSPPLEPTPPVVMAGVASGSLSAPPTIARACDLVVSDKDRLRIMRRVRDGSISISEGVEEVLAIEAQVRRAPHKIPASGEKQEEEEEGVEKEKEEKGEEG